MAGFAQAAVDDLDPISDMAALNVPQKTMVYASDGKTLLAKEDCTFDDILFVTYVEHNEKRFSVDIITHKSKMPYSIILGEADTAKELFALLKDNSPNANKESVAEESMPFDEGEPVQETPAIINTSYIPDGKGYSYVVLQVVLKEKVFGTGSGNLSELEKVINKQASKGYRLHTITTASSGSVGHAGGDRIQATMVFEKI